jgi:hypothetical protein
MTHVYRISKGPDVGDVLDSVEALEAFARSYGKGRYDVDEHSLDPFPGTDVAARAWGKVIHQRHGYMLRVILGVVVAVPRDVTCG